MDYKTQLLILSAVYGAVLLLALIQFAILHRSYPGPITHGTKKIFRLLTMAVCIGRIIYNVASPCIFYSDPTLGEKIFEMAFPRLIGIVYYSTYMLLIVVWARLFYAMQEPSEEVQSITNMKIKMYYNRLNIFLVGVQICFFLLFLAVQSDDDGYYIILLANIIFLATLMIMWAVGFGWFGILLYSSMKAVAANTFLRSRQLVLHRLRKVSIITGICTLCFTFRAILTLGYADESKLSNPSDKDRFALLYCLIYFSGEIIPFLLVLTHGSPIRFSQLEEKNPDYIDADDDHHHSSAILAQN